MSTTTFSQQLSQRWKGARNAREFNVLMALIVLCAVIYIGNPNFGTVFNLQVIVRQVAIFGILALGEMLVILTAGIDLSVGSVVAFVGVSQALLIRSVGLPTPVAILLGLAAAVLIGLYHGTAVAKWGVPAFIVTLGSLSILRGLAVGLTSSYPILIADSSFRWLGQGKVYGVPVPIIIMAVIAAILSFVLNRTRTGRNIYAVGGNPDAARLSGIPVARVLIMVYIAAAFLFGIAGTIVAGRLAQGLPSVAAGYELNAIAATIIGGTSFFGGIGTVRGTLLGAMLMAVIDNALILLGVSAFWYTFVVGAVILLAVTIDVLTTKRRRRKEELFGRLA
jgi:ribose transport system permease protein